MSSAIRQALQTRRILEKLLTRVQMTTDDEVLRGLMRLHGLNLMNNVLREYPQDVHVILLVRRPAFLVLLPLLRPRPDAPSPRPAGPRDPRQVEAPDAQQDRVVAHRGERHALPRRRR